MIDQLESFSDTNRKDSWIMNVFERLIKSKFFEYTFWAGISFVISCGTYKIILLDFWSPDSRMESLGVVLLLALLVFVFLLVFIRSGWVSRTSFGGPLRELAEGHPVLFKFLLIAFPVILFNLVNVFGPHYLFNDDPFRYREGISILVDSSSWIYSSKLSTFTEALSMWMMAHYSPYVVRLLYLLLYLTGISFCMYWISRKIFNLNPACAYLAAVLPAIYPLQFQIIAGINISYTLIGQLFTLLALIVGFCYLTRERHSWFLVILAGLLFASATRLMEQAMFLSVAVGFIYLVTSSHILRKVLLLVPVAAASLGVFYEILMHPRGAAIPRGLPAEVILQRMKMFFGYLSPVGAEYSFALSLFLLAAGTGSFFFWPGIKERISDLPHFSWLPLKLRYWILPGFACTWTFFFAFPFIALNSHMSVRTIHLAGYGPWMVMAPGLAFLLSIGVSPLRKSVKKRMVTLTVFAVIFVAGVEHINYSMQRYAKASYHWDCLSSSVSYHAFPRDTQIVITDAYMGSYSSHHIGTGYLCRLLNNRLDVGGLVGQEYFYYDPFSRADLWQTRMTGLQGTSNLHLFRLVTDWESRSRGLLQPYRYFLRVITSKSMIKEGQESGDWHLYQVDDSGNAGIKHRGHGMDQYQELLGERKCEGVEPEHICWGNPDDEFGGNSPMRE
ncbi:MAG: hypothetical protein ABIJ42_09925 [Acidobacteriota bacterium]